jgi:hypothetical protein
MSGTTRHRSPFSLRTISVQDLLLLFQMLRRLLAD